MSSNRPPQLHLALPGNNTSFKRSFDQYDFDLESPVGGAEQGASGSSNDRTKRPRSEGSLSDDGDDIQITQSSSEASLSSSSETTLASSSEADVSPSRPMRSSQPPRLPTPEIQDVEMPYYHPNESPRQSSATDANGQYMASMERYNAFDSEISVLRQSRPASPPPTLPPLTLETSSVAIDPPTMISPSREQPSNDTLHSSPPLVESRPVVNSIPPRIDFSMPITPPLFWQPVPTPPPTNTEEPISFQARLDTALDALRSDSPLLDVASLSNIAPSQPASAEQRELDTRAIDRIEVALQETLDSLRRSREEARMERLASSASRVIDPSSARNSRSRSISRPSSANPRQSRDSGVNYSDYLASLFERDSPPLRSRATRGSESRDSHEELPVRTDSSSYLDIYLHELRERDDRRRRQRSCSRSESPPSPRSRHRTTSRFGGSLSSRIWGNPNNDPEVPPQLRNDLEGLSPLRLSFNWDHSDRPVERRDRSAEREHEWTSTIPDLQEMSDRDEFSSQFYVSSTSRPLPSPTSTILSGPSEGPLANNRYMRGQSNSASNSDTTTWPPPYVMRHHRPSANHSPISNSIDTATWPPPHLMRPHRPSASNSLLSENATEIRRGRARAEMLRNLPGRGANSDTLANPQEENTPRAPEWSRGIPPSTSTPVSSRAHPSTTTLRRLPLGEHIESLLQEEPRTSYLPPLRRLHSPERMAEPQSHIRPLELLAGSSSSMSRREYEVDGPSTDSSSQNMENSSSLRHGIPGAIDFYASLPSNRTAAASERDLEASLYEYIPSPSRRRAREPLRMPEPVNTWLPGGGTNRDAGRREEGLPPFYRVPPSYWTPSSPPSLPSPDLGRFIDPLSVLESARPAGEPSHVASPIDRGRDAHSPTATRPSTNGSSRREAPTPPATAAAPAPQSTQNTQRTINLQEYHAGPFRNTLERMFGAEVQRPPGSDFRNLAPLSTLREPPLRTVFPRPPPPSRPPLLAPLDFRGLANAVSGDHRAASDAFSGIDPSVDSHRRMTSDSFPQSSIGTSHSPYSRRNMNLARGLDSSTGTHDSSAELPRPSYMPPAAPSASGATSRDRLHDYLVVHDRLHAPRYASRLAQERLESERTHAQSSRPLAHNTVQTTPEGLSHAIQVLRPDGLSLTRSRQLLQEYHRGRDRDAQLDRDRLEDRARERRLSTTNIWGDMFNEDADPEWEPWRFRQQQASRQAASTAAAGPPTPTTTSAVPNTEPRRERPRVGLDGVGSLPTRVEDILANEYMWRRGSPRRAPSHSPTRETSAPTNTFSERHARNARPRRAWFTHDLQSFSRLRRRNIGDFIRDEDFDESYEGLMRLAATIGEARPRRTPDNVLAELPTGLYKDWANEDSDPRCPICLDDYKPSDLLMKLPVCKHWLHKPCLQQWLSNASTCPVCRQNVHPKPAGGFRTLNPYAHMHATTSQAGSSRSAQQGTSSSAVANNSQPRTGWNPVPPSASVLEASRLEHRILRTGTVDPAGLAPLTARLNAARDAIATGRRSQHNHFAVRTRARLRALDDMSPLVRLASPPPTAREEPQQSVPASTQVNNSGAARTSVTSPLQNSMPPLWHTILTDSEEEQEPEVSAAQEEIDAEMLDDLVDGPPDPRAPFPWSR
ncbi:hypothetical protein HGRIS_014612 [Hohenbuehelia grisea]|uniref:RING-type domain-containing protein n=1 Tax=Hohenbuehelia grisea TaxID=104357 RepID=A0ABR3JW82_9AGAR